jgi:hypothetical protein
VNEACLKSRVREFMSQIVEQVGIRTFSDDESLRAPGIFRPSCGFSERSFPGSILNQHRGAGDRYGEF